MLGKDTPAHQSLHCQINISLGHLLHVLRNVLQVAQEASGWIRFVLTTISHRLIYGDVLSVEVILGSRNGPSRLRDDDDGKNACPITGNENIICQERNGRLMSVLLIYLFTASIGSTFTTIVVCHLVFPECGINRCD